MSDPHDLTTVGTPPSRVVVLVATIPPRRQSCERLLDELSKQTRPPDGVVLVLDGYGEESATPRCSVPVIAVHRTDKLSGAGARWGAVRNLHPDDIVICLDDDIVTIEARTLVAALVRAVEAGGGAAAAMGRGADGKGAPPGDRGRGDLIYAAGCGLTARAKHLQGVLEFAAEVKAAGGPDALGLLGDDDAIVSAHLWKSGVKIRHAATGNIYAAPTTRTSSQTAARAVRRESPDEQKILIKKITGWPWHVIGSKESNARRA